MGWNKWERKEREREREISRNISKEAKFFKKWDRINGKESREREREKDFLKEEKKIHL